jgi:hypothetical protein
VAAVSYETLRRVARVKPLPFVLAFRQRYTTEPRLGDSRICYVTYRNNKLRG